MPATLITSAAGYGKTREAVRRIRRLKARDPFAPVWVLLPTELQVNAFRSRLMAEVGEDTLFGVEFFDFYALNAHLLERFGIPQRRAQDATRYRILRHVIDQVGQQPGALAHFSAIAQTPGFVELVAAFILELKQALIEPSDFAQGAATPKDRDLALLYAAYQDYLRDHHIVDREGEGWLALATLRANPGVDLPVRLLVVDGYDQFSVVQTRLLTHLAGRVPNTILTLTFEPHRAEVAHRRFAQTRRRLSRYSPAALWEEHVADPFPEQHRREELTYLSAGLFQPGAARRDASQAVHMLEAPDRRREVSTVMREVKRLLLMGTPADQVAIVARDLTPYTPYFLETAVSYGVPIFFSRGLPLRENPAVAAFLSLIGLSRGQFRRREVMDALHSPYLLPPDLDLPQIDALERITRRYAVVRWPTSWLEAITIAGEAHRDEDEEPFTEEQIAANRERMAALRASVQTFFERVTPPRNGTARDFIAWLEGLIGRDPHVEEADEAPPPTAQGFGMIARIREGPEPALVARDLAALKRLKGVFVELMAAAELVAPGQPVTWDDFRRDLLLAVDQATIDPPRTTNRLGRVLLASVYTVRGLSHDHLFILGLSEGEFPTATPEDALYLDTERAQLQARGFDLATRADAADESSLFYELTALARQSLTLTRPYLDDKGNDWPASPYWRAVREVVTPTVRRVPIAPRPSFDEAANDSDLLLALAHALNTHAPYSAGWDQVIATLGWLHTRPAWAAWQNARVGRKIEQGRRGLGQIADSYRGQLGDPALIAHVARELGVGRLWSASQLNEYGTCPYRFFAKRLLKLEALKEPDEGMDVLQHGSMIHRILELTYQQIAAESLAIAPNHLERALAILDGVLDQVLARAPFEFSFRETRLWAHEQIEHRRHLRELVTADFSEDSPLTALAKGPRYTRFHEVGFGGRRADAPSPNVVLEGTAGPLRIYGVIDRVDQVGQRLIVVDYKTGSTHIPLSEMVIGRNVQMLIYLRAAEQLFPNHEVVGGAFWHTRKRDLSGKTLVDKNADELEHAALTLHDRVLRGRDGVFTTTPPKQEDHKCARHCEYYQLCRLSSHQRG